MFEMPGSPQPIGKVLDTAFRLFSHSFKHVFALALIASVAISMPGFIFNSVAMGDPQAIGANFGAAMALTFLVAWVVFMAFYNALFYRMNALAANAGDGAGTAIRVGARKILPVLFAGILFALAVTVGTILLIVPGIILMVSLFLYIPLIVCDNEGPLSSLSTSHRLVWGDWWRTLGVFMVPFFLYMVVYMAVGLVIGVAAALSGNMQAGQPSATFNMTLHIATIAVSVFMYPFFAAIMLSQLHDLKLRKGGVDLEARLEG